LQMISKERKRHEIESLLPWYATGTLSSSDAERVEQALAEDSVLAQRYELVLEEIAAAIHLNDTLGSPSGRAMEKLFAAIDAEEAHVPYSGRPPQPLTARPATASASG
jgi:anti-sigma-K factor RskA